MPVLFDVQFIDRHSDKLCDIYIYIYMYITYVLMDESWANPAKCACLSACCMAHAVIDFSYKAV